MKALKLLLLLPIIALCFGCGGEKSASNAIRFGTGGTGGMYYAYGTALAKMIDAEGKGHALDVKGIVDFWNPVGRPCRSCENRTHRRKSRSQPHRKADAELNA